MKTRLFVFLFVFAIIRPAYSQLAVDPNQNSLWTDKDFLSQFQNFGIINNNQCVENCTNNHNGVTDTGDDSAHDITKRASSDLFEAISSAISSMLNYVYRIFLQPWITIIDGLDRPVNSSMDKSFYTVEGRSATMEPSSKPVKWREVGTAIFEFISKLT